MSEKPTPTHTDPQLTIRLSPVLFDGVRELAEQGHYTPQEVVIEAVRNHVRPSLATAGREQVGAEAELMAYVHELVLSRGSQGGWGVDVTNEIFEQIAAHRLKVYEVAVGGDPFTFGNPEKGRINRNIGKKVKSMLKARDYTEGGKVQKGQPPRDGHSLILSYTKLAPTG